jgi:hypothetical protein
VRAEPDGVARLLDGVPLIEVKHANMQVGIHPAVLKTLLGERWDEARTVARERGPDLKPPYQSDGIAVVAGPSWSERYADLDYPRRALG